MLDSIKDTADSRLLRFFNKGYGTPGDGLQTSLEFRGLAAHITQHP